QTTFPSFRAAWTSAASCAKAAETVATKSVNNKKVRLFLIFTTLLTILLRRDHAGLNRSLRIVIDSSCSSVLTDLMIRSSCPSDNVKRALARSFASISSGGNGDYSAPRGWG